MTSKTKRWLMSLPLVMLPFTVTPMEAGAGEEVGGPCFGFVFTEGGGVVDHGTDCTFAIVGSPLEGPVGTTPIFDSPPFPLPGDLAGHPFDSDGPLIEEFVNLADISMSGFHIEWGFGLDIGIEDIFIDGAFFDTVELLGDPGAFTGVWFNDSSGHTGVHHGESFFLLTSGAFFSPTDTLIVHAELPEPATLATFGFGLAGLGLLARRRRKD